MKLMMSSLFHLLSECDILGSFEDLCELLYVISDDDDDDVENDIDDDDDDFDEKKVRMHIFVSKNLFVYNIKLCIIFVLR